MRLVGHDDEAFDVRDLRQQLFEQRYEHQVRENVSVLGVIDDEDELLGEQPRVDRVADVPRSADAVIDLEVPMIIPGDGCHAIATFEAEPVERIGELPCPPHRLANRVAMTRIVHCDGHDFPVPVEFFGVLRDRRNQQRPVHHKS